MAHWSLEPERRTLHGVFSREMPPALTIDNGDTVDFRTLDAGWSVEPQTVSSPKSVKFSPRDPERDAGHSLVGPLEIRGAEPGMILEVQIGAIRVGTWGWTSAGGLSHPVHDRLGMAGGDEAVHLWALDADQGVGRNQFGHEIRLRPFMGVMGMPTDEAGYLPTPPPRRTGGNLDCKELVSGVRLFLPIEVNGARFSVGDGHAVQGDGEVCVTAIECPMDSVSLTFHLHEPKPQHMPRALLSDSWMTLGVHADLHEATMLALEEMLSWMVELFGISRRDAYALASLAVDMRITQLANGVLGAHAVLKFDTLKMP